MQHLTFGLIAWFEEPCEVWKWKMWRQCLHVSFSSSKLCQANWCHCPRVASVLCGLHEFVNPNFPNTAFGFSTFVSCVLQACEYVLSSWPSLCSLCLLLLWVLLMCEAPMVRETRGSWRMMF